MTRSARVLVDQCRAELYHASPITQELVETLLDSNISTQNAFV